MRLALRVRFSDAQCGFKAIRADIAPELLAAVQDEAWFFDTELLVAAQRRGLRIHEVPVDWVEDTDSRVDILATALADLRGVGRLLLRRPSAAYIGLTRRPCRASGNALIRRAMDGQALTSRSRGGLERVLARPELLGLLGLAGVLDLWGLSINGWANPYYSAAVRSMSTSWHDSCSPRSTAAA